MNIFNTRNDYIKSLPKNLIMCEIGVFCGEFSNILLQNEPKELHLIDPFIGNIGSGDKDGNNMKFIDLDTQYYILKNHFLNYNNVMIHKGFSQNILQLFSDNFFDFIYIDGDHSYDGVKLDLDISYKKIKNNGIIAGHDYNKERFPGIVKAVDEFCEQNNLQINSITKDGCPTFEIIIRSK